MEEDDSSSSVFEACDDKRVFLGFIAEELEDENEEDDGGDEFQSKIGGHPLWLKHSELTVEDCGVCHEPLILLAQIYAPLEQFDHAYHRFLYVFCCTKAICWKTRCNDCVVVYRFQMGKDDEIDKALEKRVCRVCGKFAGKLCSKCKMMRYCSKSHQLMDWKEGHKTNCQEGKTDDKVRTYDCVFKEMMIETDEEIRDEETEANAAEATELALAATVANKKALEMAEEEEKKKKVDKVFLKFQARTKLYPDQILRYSFDAKKPLWIHSENQFIGKPDLCKYCGSKRVFEMQILPQLLYYLNVEEREEKAIDFGTIVVYSCEKSCVAQNTEIYQKEFHFVQKPN